MLGVYVIWDERQKEFAFPFVVKNDLVAKRVFATSVSKWPDYEDDFKLYKLGEFDAENLGRPFVQYPTPVSISMSEE